MIQITKRLTEFVWNAATLALSGSFAWKSRIKILRAVNAAGGGFVSFDPNRQANSLTSIPLGSIVTLDALGIVAGDTSTYFNVDNGTEPIRLAFPFAAGSSALPFPGPILYDEQAGTYQFDNATPNNAANLSAITYQKNGNSVSLPITLAKGDVLTVTATAASAAGTLTLIKQ